jgi:hypothetical protein
VTYWHMIVATMDTASQTRVIYWDGKPVANDKGGGRTGKSGAFSIGASTVFGGRWFQGGIEEAALWNRALTAAEVVSIYAAVKPSAVPAGGAIHAGWRRREGRKVRGASRSPRVCSRAAANARSLQGARSNAPSGAPTGRTSSAIQRGRRVQRASTIGDDSSTRRPTRDTIFSMMRKRWLLSLNSTGVR